MSGPEPVSTRPWCQQLAQRHTTRLGVGQGVIQTSLAMPSYVLVPEELQSRHVRALRLALPVLLSVLGCGIAGLFILIGTLRAFGRLKDVPQLRPSPPSL